LLRNFASGADHTLITHAKFGDDHLRGFGVAMGRILAFFVDFIRHHYNSVSQMHVSTTLHVHLWYTGIVSSQRTSLERWFVVCQEIRIIHRSSHLI